MVSCSERCGDARVIAAGMGRLRGFGYGALNHFWVGGWNQNSFYEIGGGDLTQFLDPEG